MAQPLTYVEKRTYKPTLFDEHDTGYSDVYVEPVDIETAFENVAETMIDPRMTRNDKQGSKFECFMVLLLKFILFRLGLANTYRVLHHQFTRRRYRTSSGVGWDITICKRVWNRYGWEWIPVLAIECKNWLTRYLSPSLLRSHVLRRFATATHNIQRLLITSGTRLSKLVTNKLGYCRIQHISKHYYNQLTPLVSKLTNGIHENMSYNRQLHKPHKLLASRIVSFVSFLRSSDHRGMIRQHKVGEEGEPSWDDT